MTGLIGGFVQVIWFFYALIALLIIALAVKFCDTAHAKWAAGVVGMLLFLIPPLGLGAYGWYTESKLRERAQTVNAYFTKRCAENAKETIYRVVSDVDSIAIFQTPVTEEMKSAFATANPLLEDRYISGKQPWFSWLNDYRTSQGELGYSIFELVRPDNSVLRYSAIPTGKKVVVNLGFGDKTVDEWLHREESAPKPSARYGVKWIDISALEDRKNFVVGARRVITDLQSNDVIAETTVYLVDNFFGEDAHAAPWHRAAANAANAANGISNIRCPKNFKRVQQILIPAKINASKGENRGS